MGNEFSEKDGASFLELARQSIREKLDPKKDEHPSLKEQFGENITSGKRGVFVSLHKHGSLRGCIGNIEPVKPVLEGIVENAKHAAFNDSRFQPLSQSELDETKIEVSILTLPQKINYSNSQDLLEKIRPWKDGVIIKKSFHQATFLPQVWKQLPRPEDFFSHLCLKAGLSSTAWEKGDLEVSIYQVQSFEEV